MSDNSIEHTYFEKSIKNQTLIMERSALGRQQVMSIMSNEMIRRVEVMGENLPQEDKNKVVNKYTQQLVNSEFNWRQCRDIQGRSQGGGATGPWPPPIGQDSKGDLAIYRPLSRTHIYAAPPNRKSWLRPWVHQD